MADSFDSEVTRDGKERRAYATDTVQIQGPQQGLNYAHAERAVLDLGPQVEAAQARSEVFLNPKIFQDMSAITDNLNDARRNTNEWDVKIGLEEDLHDFKEALADKEKITQQNQTLTVNRSIMGMHADLTERIEEAKRNENGIGVYETLVRAKEEYDKMEEAFFQQSNFMGEAFRKAKDDFFMSKMDEGIKTDIEINKAKATYAFKTNSNYYATGTLTGLFSKEEAKSQWEKNNMPLLASMDNATQNDLVQQFHNQLSLAEITRIAKLATDPSIPADCRLTAGQARAAIFAFIADPNNLRTTYEGEDYEGNKIKIEASLDESTIKSAIQMAASLQEKSDVDVSGAYSSYEKLTDLSSYYTSTTPQTAHDHFVEAVNTVKNIGKGSKESLKQIAKITERYHTDVAPKVKVHYALQLGESTGNLSAVKSNLLQMASKMEACIKSGELDKIPGILYSDGTVSISTASGIEDEFMQIMADANATTKRTMEMLYYNKLVDIIRKEVSEYRVDNGDSLGAIDANFGKYNTDIHDYMNNVEGYLSYNAQTGGWGYDLAEVQGIKDKLKERKEYADNKFSEVPHTSDNMGDTKTLYKAYSSIVNMSEKQAFMSFWGNVFSGDISIITSALGNTSDGDEKAFLQDLSMYSLIFGSTNPNKDTWARMIQESRTAQGQSNFTVAEVKHYAENVDNGFLSIGFNDLESEIQQALVENNVSYKYRPAAERALSNLAMAYGFAWSNGSKKVFNKQVIKEFLNSTFKNGRSIAEAESTGVSIEKQMEEEQKLKKVADDVVKATELSDRNITFEYDPELQGLTLRINGAPFTTAVSYSNGSVVRKPVFIGGIKYKPQGMPEEKFYRAQATLATSVLVSMIMMNSSGDSKFKEKVMKYNKGMSAQEVSAQAERMVAAAMKPSVQAEYYNWYARDYRGTFVPRQGGFINDTIVKNVSIGTSESGQVMRCLDFLHAQDVGKKQKQTVPDKVFVNSGVSPRQSLNDYIKGKGNKYGVKITASTDGGHLPGSSHYSGKAVDIGYEAGFANVAAPANDMLMKEPFEDLWYGYLKPAIDRGEISTIGTGFSCLIAKKVAKGRNIDGAEIGNIDFWRTVANYKNKEGKLVFVDYSNPKNGKGNHRDHFHVEYYDPIFSTNYKYEKKVDPAWETKAVVAMKNNINVAGSPASVTERECLSALRVYKNYKYTASDIAYMKKTDGAGYSEDAYKSEFSRAQFALTKLKRAQIALGSMNLAIAAMNGAEFDCLFTGEGAGQLKPVKNLNIDKVLDLYEKLGGSYEGVNTRPVFRIIPKSKPNPNNKKVTGPMFEYTDTYLKREYGKQINEFIRGGIK